MEGYKFGRSYRVTIDLGDGSQPIIITPPFTIQFTVNRQISSSVNSCYLDIYNLSERVRELIFQEPYIPARTKTLTFEAGYDTLSEIFKGTIKQADSHRDGTEIITSIDCLSGSWDINSTTVYTTLAKDQTVGDIIKFLAGSFKGLEIGAISEGYPSVLSRPVTLNGNAWDLLKKYSNRDVHIDNDKIYVLQRQDVIEGEVTVINLETGIIDSPKRSGGALQVQTMFEPRIRLDQKVSIESTIQSIYNGTYKVNGIQHTGIISEAVGGDCRTVINLYTSNLVFRTVRQDA